MDAVAAISDPVRREILISKQSAISPADMLRSLTRISRHLRVLRECGLVVAEIRGRQWFYLLDTAPLEALESWLAQLHDRWSAPLDALETEVYRTRRERRASRSMPREDRHDTYCIGSPRPHSGGS